MSWFSPVLHTPELKLDFVLAEVLSSTEGSTSFKPYKVKCQAATG